MLGFVFYIKNIGFLKDKGFFVNSSASGLNYVCGFPEAHKQQSVAMA